MFIAVFKCTSFLCSDGHRLAWDDVRPPDPTRRYCYTCPCQHRVVLIPDIGGLRFFAAGSAEAGAMIGLTATLSDWEQRSAVTFDYITPALPRPANLRRFRRRRKSGDAGSGAPAAV